jgi:hypothetical protein
MSTPSPRRIIAAGLAGGVVLNLIDTPWSVLVMLAPQMRFLESHGLASSALTGPWFMLTHLAYMLLIAWLYALARPVRGTGWKTALSVALAVLVVNRAFGFGNVLIGIMPMSVFLGFSASFVPGTIISALVAARIVDKAGATAPAAVRL